jgi:hypothetical protein
MRETKYEENRPFRALLTLLEDTENCQSSKSDPTPLPVLKPVEKLDDEIKGYVDTRLKDIDDRLMVVDKTVGSQSNRIDGLSKNQYRQKGLIIDSVKSRLEQDFTNGSGPIMTYIHKSKKINDYIREEVDRHILKVTKFDELETKLTEIVDVYVSDFDSVEERFSKLEKKYVSTERVTHSEANEFIDSSPELIDSTYSLADILANAPKPKIKRRRGKENKITLIYDSPNPAKVELRPNDIGSLELTIFSRGMNAQEIREKTLVFDPYNPETNNKHLEIFLDEINSHYADNSLDSLITSLNNPGLNEYFGKHMSPHFKKIYELLTNELNSEFRGENIDLTSKLRSVNVERNKKRSGYGAFSSGKKLFGVISPILFPLKLFTYLGRIVE